MSIFKLMSEKKKFDLLTIKSTVRKKKFKSKLGF